MKTLFRLLLLLATALPAMAYRDLETGTFLTRDPAGFVDGPNLYAYVNQNPWTAFDPEGLDAVKIGENTYKYVIRPELDPKQNPNANIRGSFVTSFKSDRLSGNCAMGAQWTAGTQLKDGVHDVPSTKTWTRGAPVSADTAQGTMVARSWIQDANGNWVYPSMNIADFQKAYPGVPINHVGTLEGVKTDKDGKVTSVTLQDQFKTDNGQLKSRTHAGTDGWYEVNGSKPYEDKPSDSAVIPHPVDPNVKPDPTKQPNPAPVEVPNNTNPGSNSARQQREQQSGGNNNQPKPAIKWPWQKDN